MSVKAIHFAHLSLSQKCRLTPSACRCPADSTVKSRSRRSTPCPGVKIAWCVSLAWVRVMRHTHTHTQAGFPSAFYHPRSGSHGTMHRHGFDALYRSTTGYRRVVHEDDTCLIFIYFATYCAARLNLRTVRWPYFQTELLHTKV